MRPCEPDICQIFWLGSITQAEEVSDTKWLHFPHRSCTSFSHIASIVLSREFPLCLSFEVGLIPIFSQD